LYAPAIEPGNLLATSIQVKKFMGSSKETPAKLKQSSRSVPYLDDVTAASSANRPPLAAYAKDTALTICFQDGWFAIHRVAKSHLGHVGGGRMSVARQKA